MKRLCSNCFQRKDLSEFHKKKSGHQYNCKVCQSGVVNFYRTTGRVKPKSVLLKLEFTASEWQQILLEMGDKKAREFLKVKSKEMIINRVYSV